MASNTQQTRTRRKLRARKAGRTRKNREGRKSTQSYTELFEGLGAPGQPVAGAKSADADS